MAQSVAATYCIEFLLELSHYYAILFHYLGFVVDDVEMEIAQPYAVTVNHIVVVCAFGKFILVLLTTFTAAVQLYGFLLALTIVLLVSVA